MNRVPQSPWFDRFRCWPHIRYSHQVPPTTRRVWASWYSIRSVSALAALSAERGFLLVSQTPDERTAEFYAQTYDGSVPDWPGEIDFYQAMAADVRRNGGTVLEVACGTGRV